MSPRYSAWMMVLHWTMAALMIAAWWLGERLEDTPFGPQKFQAMLVHVYVGLAIMVLLIPRLLARIKGAPPMPATMPTWEKLPASLVHLLLYAAMAALIVTGLIAITSGRGFPLAPGVVLPALFGRGMHEAMEQAHGLANTAFLVLFALHVLGAVWHAVRRDGLIWRMIPRPGGAKA